MSQSENNHLSLEQIIAMVGGWNKAFNYAEFNNIKQQRIFREQIIAKNTTLNDPVERYEHINHYLDLIDQAFDDSAIQSLQKRSQSLLTADTDILSCLAWLTTQSLSSDSRNRTDCLFVITWFCRRGRRKH